MKRSVKANYMTNNYSDYSDANGGCVRVVMNYMKRPAHKTERQRTKKIANIDEWAGEYLMA